MGRHSKEEVKTQGAIEKKRKDALEKFFGLSSKAMKHIEWSLEATIVCNSCTVNATGGHLPGKAKDDEGKCAFCHAKGHVPDKNQRNWATGEIADRIAPKPKPMEMTIDSGATLDELEKDFKGKSDAELRQFVSGGLTVIEAASKAVNG